MTDDFPHTWQASVLNGAPMIMPARHFVFPLAIAGEEEALARGALWLNVKPVDGSNFVAQCALGFSDKNLASGLWSTPNPDHLLAVAGGYAYRIPASQPEATALLPIRPVVSVHAAPEAEALILIGFHDASSSHQTACGKAQNSPGKASRKSQSTEPFSAARVGTCPPIRNSHSHSTCERKP